MRYIDAEKLIERLEEMKQTEYENCGGVNSKTGALQEVQELIESLQQEQPEVDLNAEIEKELRLHYNDDQDVYWWNYLKNSFRHFYELGFNARKA